MSRQLVVNADDLGYDPAIDRGILQAARQGLVTSTTLMVNMPGAPEAARDARLLPGLGLGLHVNLAVGPSLSGELSLCHPHGALDPCQAERAARQTLAREIEAQWARFIELVGRSPTHLDVHKHLHRHEVVLQALVEVALRHRLPIRSIDEPMRQALRARGVPTPDAFVGETGPVAYWSPARLVDALAGAVEGITELMCHPGFKPERVSTSYGAQREGELLALLDPQVLARARQNDPQLVTFEALSLQAPLWGKGA